MNATIKAAINAMCTTDGRFKSRGECRVSTGNLPHDPDVSQFIVAGYPIFTLTFIDAIKIEFKVQSFAGVDFSEAEAGLAAEAINYMFRIFHIKNMAIACDILGHGTTLDFINGNTEEIASLQSNVFYSRMNNPEYEKFSIDMHVEKEKEGDPKWLAYLDRRNIYTEEFDSEENMYLRNFAIFEAFTSMAYIPLSPQGGRDMQTAIAAYNAIANDANDKQSINDYLSQAKDISKIVITPEYEKMSVSNFFTELSFRAENLYAFGREAQYMSASEDYPSPEVI